MSNIHNISATVILRNHQVILNEKVVFETAEDLELSLFLKACYQDLEIDYGKFYKRSLMTIASRGKWIQVVPTLFVIARI